LKISTIRDSENLANLSKLGKRSENQVTKGNLTHNINHTPTHQKPLNNTSPTPRRPIGAIKQLPSTQNVYAPNSFEHNRTKTPKLTQTVPQHLTTFTTTEATDGTKTKATKPPGTTTTTTTRPKRRPPLQTAQIRKSKTITTHCVATNGEYRANTNSSESEKKQKMKETCRKRK
jgi:hypothetical protein